MLTVGAAIPTPVIDVWYPFRGAGDSGVQVISISDSPPTVLNDV